LHQQIEALTPREYEVLTYVITGIPNKHIAYALDVNEITIEYAYK